MGKRFYPLKKHDKFLSTFPFNLEKENVKDFHSTHSFYRFLCNKIVTCSIWGPHMWHLTGSDVSSNAVICYIWRAQSIALTRWKHSFDRSRRCKENGSRWLSTFSESAHFPRICPRGKFFLKYGPFWGGEVQILFDKEWMFLLWHNRWLGRLFEVHVSIAISSYFLIKTLVYGKIKFLWSNN